jgi:hypothetical protein
MNNLNRRGFLSAVAAGAGVLPGQTQPASAKGSFRLGCVTYNLFQGSDVETIIKTLESVGFEAVELRTGHKHGVEPSLGAEERVRIRRRFESSKVRLLSYGTTCRFQSPDPGERKKQLETPGNLWIWRTTPARWESSSSPWDFPTVCRRKRASPTSGPPCAS